MSTGGWLFFCVLVFGMGWCCGGVYELRAARRWFDRRPENEKVSE